MHSYKKTIYRWRVRAGFIGIILVVILSKPNWISFFSGLFVCFMGLLLRTWASGHLRKEKDLIVSGPYQYSRNPLYLGNFILGISVVITSYSWVVLAIFTIYFLFFYPPVIKREMEKMKALFPEKYKIYKKKVPLFFPSLRPVRPPEKIKFSWKIYKKNREYRALTGAAMFWLIMAVKIVLF